jgi:hypothetical protein
MSEQEMAAELARLREQLAEFENGASGQTQGQDAPTYNEREVARLRARIAELEGALGL